MKNEEMSEIYTIRNDAERQAALAAAEEALRAGGVVAIPTDTVYGFAALVHAEAAIAKLYQIKERDPRKSIAVLLGDAEQAHQVAHEFPAKAQRLAAKYWPGALTIIIRKKAGLPAALTSNDLVGLRIPDHAFTRELIRRTGPLAVTSANISGQPPAKAISEFADELGPQLDLIIDGGPSSGGIPSSVINCESEPARILREGAIPGKDLRAC